MVALKVGPPNTTTGMSDHGEMRRDYLHSAVFWPRIALKKESIFDTLQELASELTNDHKNVCIVQVAEISNPSSCWVRTCGLWLWSVVSFVRNIYYTIWSWSGGGAIVPQVGL